MDFVLERWQGKVYLIMSSPMISTFTFTRIAPPGNVRKISGLQSMYECMALVDALQRWGGFSPRSSLGGIDWGGGVVKAFGPGKQEVKCFIVFSGAVNILIKC